MKNIEEITKRLEEGVKEVFSGENYKQYLDFMSKFHDYSVNNIILIYMQKPDASLVAGYRAWQTKFNRNVKKGEKGIQILAPIPHRFVIETEDADGNKIEKEIKYNTFRAVSVFDILQTEGEEVSTICKELTGDLEKYDKLFEKIKKFSPVPIEFEELDKNGYFSDTENKIALRQGMSEKQTIKTLVHEVSHAILHKKDGEEEQADRKTKEVQAESIAYIVCNGLGIDTSDYSFGYIAGWSGSKEAKQLFASMEVIKGTAKAMLEAIA